MKKVNLTQQWSHQGKLYGPGAKTEVPDTFPDDVEKRLAKEPATFRIGQSAPVDPDEGGDEEITGDYENHTSVELLHEAERRGLKITGTGKDGNILKADLVKALAEDDGE